MVFLKKYWIMSIIILAALITACFFVFKGPKVQYAEVKDIPHIEGNADASVSLLEYSDFQCPACGVAFMAVKELVANYGDKIRFEYRNFPLVGLHRYAYQAAEAAECAADQDKFWQYHDLLFQNQEHLTKSDLIAYAGQVEGLDVTAWQNCLASGVKAKRVDEDLAEADKQGYNSTPTFILNGQKVDNWQELPSLIQHLLQPLVPLNNSASTTTSVK